MKRIVSIIIIAVVIICAAMLAFFKKANSSSVQGPVQKSQAFYLTGEVLIKGKDAKEWQKARSDMAIQNGDTITTSADSGIEIKFGREQKNFIALKDNTDVRAGQIERKGDKSLELKKGKVLTLIEKLDENSKFEVRTPQAVCGVVGTGFETSSEKEATVIKVYEGQVQVKGFLLGGLAQTDEIAVREGNMVKIIKNRPPENPVPIDSQDLKSWQEWKGELDRHLFRTLYVFLDEDSLQNHYHPSGWVGDYDAIRRVSWKENAHSGESCLKFVYTGKTPQGAGWVGVYWQNPVNNWGDVKGGYNLKGARKLTFWARGDKGGETINRFGIGGIGGEYPDSARTEIGSVILEKEWRQYSINLSGKDLSYISGGFYWITDKNTNPEGCVFYIDDIRYE
jgi:co-chaperonin GroES (HSP10)